ncbi:MAG TPA: STAS domain-containing protein [Gaiellales bacterium]|jgi:anti-anti-sigma factor
MQHAGSLDITPGPTSIVRLMGEHDDATERHVREALLRELALDRNVVVSLERVSLLGSQVIGTLVAAQLVAERAGLILALVVPEGEHRARRSLELTGLLDALMVFERMPDALRASAARELAPPIGSHA